MGFVLTVESVDEAGGVRALPLGVGIGHGQKRAPAPLVLLQRDPDNALIIAVFYSVVRQKGDELPVSAFRGREDGVIDMGLTAYEKRGIAVNIPSWDGSQCIQCNRCSFVCPHAAIRPYLLDEQEAANAPEGFVSVPLKGVKGDAAG